MWSSKIRGSHGNWGNQRTVHTHTTCTYIHTHCTHKQMYARTTWVYTDRTSTLNLCTARLYMLSIREATLAMYVCSELQRGFLVVLDVLVQSRTFMDSTDLY